MTRFAFKEWAAICQALGDGRQSLILRKGGIAEAGGEFQPDHARFWLYPTAFHEHREALKEVALSDAVGSRDRLHLSLIADVDRVFRVDDWAKVESLDDLHLWTREAVRKKFDYRAPGLFVLLTRIRVAAAPIEIEETPAFAGCKTWVDLGEDFRDDGAAVLDEERFGALRATVIERLAK